MSRPEHGTGSTTRSSLARREAEENTLCMIRWIRFESLKHSTYHECVRSQPDSRGAVRISLQKTMRESAVAESETRLPSFPFS